MNEVSIKSLTTPYWGLPREAFVQMSRYDKTTGKILIAVTTARNTREFHVTKTGKVRILKPGGGQNEVGE
jgi:hypothetical protein